MATSKLSLAGPITLRDVARVAGVHPGTVSRALNPETRALVNERTAQRVLEAAKELGYRPNPIARGLRTNRSNTIGVLVPDLMNPLFAAVVRGIEDGLRDGGYTPLIANTDNDAERELGRQQPGQRAAKNCGGRAGQGQQRDGQRDGERAARPECGHQVAHREPHPLRVASVERRRLNEVASGGARREVGLHDPVQHRVARPARSGRGRAAAAGRGPPG